MVTGVTYRHPAVLAEHRGYGIPFPPAGQRVAMLDEALQVIKALWKSLRVVAGHAGEWNATSPDPADWSRRNQVLTGHCNAIGRDPSTIRRGVQVFLHPAQRDQMAKTLDMLPGYEAAGCSH